MPKLPESDKPTWADLRRDPERYAAEWAQLREIADQCSANMIRAGETFRQALERGLVHVPVDYPI